MLNSMFKCECDSKHGMYVWSVKTINSHWAHCIVDIGEFDYSNAENNWYFGNGALYIYQTFTKRMCSVNIDIQLDMNCGGKNEEEEISNWSSSMLIRVGSFFVLHLKTK